MSLGMTRLTESVRIRSSGATWIQVMPASLILRSEALVNLRSFLTSTSPASLFTSLVQRWPTSSAGSTFFRMVRPSNLITSGL